MTRKILRVLEREFPDAEISITSSSNHYRLRLPNGGIVIVSGTPSDSDWLRYVRADVRRAKRHHHQH